MSTKNFLARAEDNDVWSAVRISITCTAFIIIIILIKSERHDNV